jgi:hypothetical protein
LLLSFDFFRELFGKQRLLPTTKDNEKSEIGSARQIYRLPPEIRYPPFKRQAGQPVRVYAGKAVTLKPEKSGLQTVTASASLPMRSSLPSDWSEPSSGTNTVGNEVSADPRSPYAATDAVSRWMAGFQQYPEITKNLTTIRPASIDRYLKKGRESPHTEGEMSHQTLEFPENRIPPYAPSTQMNNEKYPISSGTSTCRTLVRHHCGQTTFDQYVHTLTDTDVASGWVGTSFPPQHRPFLDF